MLFSRTKTQIFADAIEGIVEETISPRQPGRVKCDGTYWPAKLHRPNGQPAIRPGTRVSVVGIEGITLLVCPANSPKSATDQSAPL